MSNDISPLGSVASRGYSYSAVQRIQHIIKVLLLLETPPTNPLPPASGEGFTVEILLDDLIFIWNQENKTGDIWLKQLNICYLGRQSKFRRQKTSVLWIQDRGLLWMGEPTPRTDNEKPHQSTCWEQGKRSSGWDQVIGDWLFHASVMLNHCLHACSSLKAANSLS